MTGWLPPETRKKKRKRAKQLCFYFLAIRLGMTARRNEWMLVQSNIASEDLRGQKPNNLFTFCFCFAVPVHLLSWEIRLIAILNIKSAVWMFALVICCLSHLQVSKSENMLGIWGRKVNLCFKSRRLLLMVTTKASQELLPSPQDITFAPSCCCCFFFTCCFVWEYVLVFIFTFYFQCYSDLERSH